MQLHKLSRIAFFLILILALAACGGDNEEAVDGISLPQSISSSEQEDGVATVYYPDGWVGEENWLGIFLYSSQELFESETDSAPEEGEVFVWVLAGLADEDSASEYGLTGLTAESSPGEYIEAFLSDTSGNGDEMSDIEEFDAGDRPAAIVFGTTTEEGQTTGTIITVTKIDDAFGALIFFTNDNEVDDNVALAKAMITKLEFVQD
jgi:hypothetical protein